MKKQTLLLTVTVFFWFALYVHVPYQTPYLAAVGVSAGFIGIIVGAYGITQMLLRLFVGVLADYAGKQKVFVIMGVGLAGLASVLRIVLPNGTGFLIANLLSGCASSMWISYMVLFSRYYTKEEQQKATSKVIMACNLGMCVGFVFSSVFYGTQGMKFLCMAGAAVGTAGIIAAVFVEEERPKMPVVRTRTESVNSLLKICTNRKLILFSLLALVQQGIQMATAMSFTTQLLENLGASSVFIGCASVFYMIAAVLSAEFGATKMYKKKGAGFYIPLVFFLTAFYCMLVPVVGNIYVIFCLQALPGMSTGILLSCLTSESMQEVPPEKSSTAMGFFQAVYAVGMTIFPAVVGKLAETVNIGAGYTFLAAAALVGAVVSIAYYAKKQDITKKLRTI